MDRDSHCQCYRMGQWKWKCYQSNVEHNRCQCWNRHIYDYTYSELLRRPGDGCYGNGQSNRLLRTRSATSPYVEPATIPLRGLIGGSATIGTWSIVPGFRIWINISEHNNRDKRNCYIHGTPKRYWRTG